MRELNYFNKVKSRIYFINDFIKFLFLFSLIFYSIDDFYAQCQVNSGQVSGYVKNDINFDGVMDSGDLPLEGIGITLFDSHQHIVAQTQTGNDGNFVLSGLTDGSTYRLEYSYDDYFVVSGFKDTRFVTAPVCDVNLLLHKPVMYVYDNPDVGMPMFLQGKTNQFTTSGVVLSYKSNFTNTGGISKIAQKSDVGSVWGMAFMKTTQQVLTSAFVKQYAYLGPGGLGAIYASQRTVNGWETSEFIDLLDYGIDLGNMTTPDAQECEYGAQVGKIGLGAIALTDDEKFLYAVNMYKNELIKIPTDPADFDNIEEIPVPNPQCSGGSMHTFALKYYHDKLYVGVTCGAEVSKDSMDNVAYVYEYNPISNNFQEIFSTDYPKGYLHDEPTFDVKTQHWITDIEFTDEGNMIIVLNDRTGQRYCFGPSGRLDTQNGDILLVWNDNGTWRLENNGKAGIYTGSGVGDGEGPGGGEFFGYDYWPSNPALHPETVTGSALILEGTGEVIVPVYDPETKAYSGGVKRFNTSNGALNSVFSIYTHTTFPQMGKASGFGDLDAIYDPLPLEIGDYVWFDADKDGVQDPGESGISGLDISLYDENCNKVGVTQTDANGYYRFNRNNVDLNNDGNFESPDILKTYYVVIEDNRFSNDELLLNGDTYYLTVLNKGVGLNKDKNDSDASIARNLCDSFNGKPFIEVKTKSSGQNYYDADFGFSESKIFDLALRKTFVSSKTVHYGDIVTFKISVYNQGTVTAHNIEVTDYLNSGFNVDPLSNTEWVFNPQGDKAKYVYTSELKPGESFDVLIKMEVKPDASLEELVNYAEISSALDPGNNPGNDVDSVMDDDPDNDIGGIPNYGLNNTVLVTDDLIDDDGTIDEDDHDPAAVKVLDLALQKMVSDPDKIYTNGDVVVFDFNIFNQGNVAAQTFEVTDYINSNFIFDPQLNPGWTKLSDSLVVYEVNEELLPFSKKHLEIKLRISNSTSETELMNYGEISKETTFDEQNPKDYDSYPNQVRTDDIGGAYNTASDNKINGSPMSNVPDEDDQDVAAITITNYDLALTKKAIDHNIEKGQNGRFEIEVFNQGSITADRITLVDYLDQGFVLDDPEWSIYPNDPTKASILLSVGNGYLPPEGLLPGKSIKVTINLYLEDVADGIDFLTNEVEISSSYDIAGNNLGIYDKDSTPDDIKGNDPKGNDDQLDGNGTDDEDDHDWATVFVRSRIILDPCVCLNNASEEGDGQFVISISIISPSGENWVIDSIYRFYDMASPAPPTAPFEYALGTVVPETQNDPKPGLSTYTIQGKQVDGISYYVRFKNNLGDTKFIDLASGVCSYDDITVEGPTGTCMNSSEVYKIQNPDPNAIYTWSLTGMNPGGTINGPATGTEVSIDWGNIPGVYDLKIEANPVPGQDICMSPKTLKVKVGNSAGSMALDDYVVGSVDMNCELVVEPEVVISTPVNSTTPFKIIIIDPDGNMLPDNIITSEYIGMDMMVKVIDQCSGQQGMSIVKAIDKQKPEIDCADAEVDCDLMSDYPGPVVTDNCDSNPELIITNETVEFQDCN